MLDECKVGFVGAGGVAMRHARHLAQLKDVRVVGVTDPNAAAAQSFAETTDAAAVKDLDELIKTSPDAVYVCVPPHAHGAIEEQLLDAGIAIFVEKPLALDLPTAERIAAAASKAGVATAVGHHWRYSPADPFGWSPDHGSTASPRSRGGASGHCPAVRSSSRQCMYST